MKSESEDFCKSCFDKYLRELLPDSIFMWEEVEQIHEPPEFYLTVDGIKFAVEVTRLFLKADVGTKRALPIRIVSDELRKFVIDDIETVAKQSHFLQGTYSVIFSKPITNFTQVKGFIQDGILSYISATQDVAKAPQQVVYNQDSQKCSIEKTHAEDDKIVMAGPFISRREDEVLTEFQQLLDKSLSEKEKKLRKVCLPKILLLHNKYYFAELQTYKKCISNAPTLPSFQAIFLVESNGKVFILYSKVPVWMFGG